MQRLMRKAFISIHAPAKGATKEQDEHATLTQISIHAPAKGATGAAVELYKKTDGFQSTLPRRERLCTWLCNHNSNLISIHAPAKGATVFLIILIQFKQDFNPRSREGSDQGFHT